MYSVSSGSIAGPSSLDGRASRGVCAGDQLVPGISLDQARKRDFRSSPSKRTHGPREFWNQNQDKTRPIVVGTPPGPLSPPAMSAAETAKRYAVRSELSYHSLTRRVAAPAKVSSRFDPRKSSAKFFNSRLDRMAPRHCSHSLASAFNGDTPLSATHPYGPPFISNTRLPHSSI